MRRLASATVLAVLACGPALADGDLDPLFGSSGRVTSDFGGRSDSANAVAIQSDGKIVVAGASANAVASDFLVARYMPNGALDTSFGAGGSVVTDFGGDEVAHALAIATDGRIVVVGTRTRDGGSDIAIARYTSDGTPDASFDSDGRRIVDLDGDDFGNAVAIDADGKIVVASTRTNSTGSFVALTRYNDDGSFDTTLAGNGKRFTRFGGDDFAEAIAIQRDGRILIAGSRRNDSGSSFMVTRFDPDGDLDSTFNGNGKRVTDFGSDAVAHAIALRADDKIVVVGTRTNANGGDFALALYDTDGTPLTSFDGDGKSTEDLGGNEDGRAVAIQADGKIVVAGARTVSGASSFAVARFNADGNPDHSFHASGAVTTDFGSSSSSAAAVAVTGSGALIAAGTRGAGSNADVALARYTSSVVHPTGALEIPGDGSFQSGVGLMSGWVCKANQVALVLDDRWVIGAAYGTARADTVRVCEDADNGFGVLFNWNLLGEGDHTIRALADGAEVGRANFHVTTLGTSFLRDASGTFMLPNFPRKGTSVSVGWDESQQNFVIRKRQRSSSNAVVAGRASAAASAVSGASAPVSGMLEIPQPGSFQSGVSLLSGWVCDASDVTLEIDGTQRLAAAYGTSRDDTLAACGDTNNGFGLLFNWNLLGDGPHRVRALADGVEFGRANLTVTTLGTSFLRGASGQFDLADFPQAGSSVTIVWDESHQGFVIVGHH